MKFLVTGLTGFAGPHLARLLLQEGHEVYGLIRGSNGRQMDLLDVMTAGELQEITWLYSDLTDYSSVYSAFSCTQFDGVFHLAAQSHPPTSFTNPVETFNSNIMGSMNLIDIIKRTQEHCRLHFCSTSEVYGDDCKEVGVLKEGMLLNPVNPYGISKATIDLYLQEQIEAGLPCFITRAFSHTGPRRGFNFSISSDAYQIAKMKLGIQDKTLLIGNLQTERVVMDVRDCVNAYYMLMISGYCGIYNVCGEDVHKMQYFTDLLIEASGLDDIEQEIYEPFYRPIDIQIQMADTEKIRSIGWKETYTLKQTMKDLLDYWIWKLSYNQKAEF